MKLPQIWKAPDGYYHRLCSMPKTRQDFVEKSSFLCVVYLWISPHFRGHYVNVGLEHKIKRRSGR